MAQIQADTILSEGRVNSGSDVTSDLDTAPEMPLAHNRTTRQANNRCLLRIERVWDKCRGQLVDRYQCRSQHVSCQQAIPKHNKPKCETVYGYPQAKFVSLCASLPIDCRCAVWNNLEDNCIHINTCIYVRKTKLYRCLFLFILTYHITQCRFGLLHLNNINISFFKLNLHNSWSVLPMLTSRKMWNKNDLKWAGLVWIFLLELWNNYGYPILSFFGSQVKVHANMLNAFKKT